MESWKRMLPSIPIMSGPIVSGRALYRIALYGRPRTKDRSQKSQFSDTLLGSRRGRREAAYEPAEQEKDCASEKDGKTRRVVPGIVDILADVEQGPKEERACAEILNDLGGLGGD